MTTRKFTIILSNYNQENYIYEAIDSIIKQDYKNIELIISDDASKVFYQNKISKYIASKRNNIDLKFVVNENNIGTVATYNRCLKKATGEYILIFAADDRLNNEKVLSNFVQYFESNKNAMIVTSVTNLYDEKFSNITRTFPNNEEKKKLKVGSAYLQNKNLYKGPFFAPGATAYKKELFNDLNGFNNQYYLIEDWSNFLRCTRLGYKIYFMDKITLDHRGGGVSESGTIPQKVYRAIINDTYNIYKNEIFPNMHKMSKKDTIKILNRYKIFIWYYGKINFNFFINYILVSLTNYKYFSYLIRKNILEIFTLLCSFVLSIIVSGFITNHLLFMLPIIFYILFKLSYILVRKIIKKIRAVIKK